MFRESLSWHLWQRTELKFIMSIRGSKCSRNIFRRELIFAGFIFADRRKIREIWRKLNPTRTSCHAVRDEDKNISCPPKMLLWLPLSVFTFYQKYNEDEIKAAYGLLALSDPASNAPPGLVPRKVPTITCTRFGRVITKIQRLDL